LLKDQPEYEVNAIIDSKVKRNKLYYLLDWVGYMPEDRTWEPAKNVANALDSVQDFHRRYPDKPIPSSCIFHVIKGGDDVTNT
jgi:hypothetical protein